MPINMKNYRSVLQLAQLAHTNRDRCHGNYPSSSCDFPMVFIYVIKVWKLTDSIPVGKVIAVKMLCCFPHRVQWRGKSDREKMSQGWRLHGSQELFYKRLRLSRFMDFSFPRRERNVLGKKSDQVVYCLFMNHWPTFLSLTVWVYLHSNVCSMLQNTHLFCIRVRFGRSRSSKVTVGLWTFRSQDVSFPGRFVPWTFRLNIPSELF